MAQNGEKAVVIVGGGPQGLACLAALHEHAFSTAFDATAFTARVGYSGHELVGKVHVIDPGTHFMEGWNNRFEMLKIEHLRSPM